MNELWGYAETLQHAKLEVMFRVLSSRWRVPGSGAGKGTSRVLPHRPSILRAWWSHSAPPMEKQIFTTSTCPGVFRRGQKQLATGGVMRRTCGHIRGRKPGAASPATPNRAGPGPATGHCLTRCWAVPWERLITVKIFPEAANASLRPFKPIQNGRLFGYAVNACYMPNAPC